jgi:hypothetical protein
MILVEDARLRTGASRDVAREALPLGVMVDRRTL